MTKVWHISRFRQRYELPEDVRLNRKGPLIYTKDFVGGGSDDESCAHWRQLIALRSKRNWLALRGAFSELKNVAGNMSQEYRGYLLDSNFQPASVKEIGRWLGISEQKAQKIIEELRDVGLLELVVAPQFNGQPRKRTGKSGRPRSSPRKSKKGNSGGARARPRNSGKRRNPLKKKAKVKTKTKVKVNGNGKAKSKEKKKRLNKNKPKSPPAKTTQPIKPQVFAERDPVIQFPGPSELNPPRRVKNQRLDIIAKKILHNYNPQSKQFAFEIYEALGLPWDPTSEMGRRELGCFASVWEKVAGWGNAGISLEAIEELRDRAISEAKKIAKRQQNRKKGAVWCTVFDNLKNACKRRKVK